MKVNEMENISYPKANSFWTGGRGVLIECSRICMFPGSSVQALLAFSSAIRVAERLKQLGAPRLVEAIRAGVPGSAVAPVCDMLTAMYHNTAMYFQSLALLRQTL